ncbi:MAG: hypothetical protein Q9225_006393, partial [Loekoesia sp. 1 TL-2023]
MNPFSLQPSPSDPRQEQFMRIKLKNQVIQNVKTDAWRGLDDLYSESFKSVLQEQEDQARNIACIDLERRTHEADHLAELARIKAQHDSDHSWVDQRVTAAETAAARADIDRDCLRQRVHEIESGIIDHGLTLERRLANLTISEGEEMQGIRSSVEKLEEWRIQSTSNVAELERGCRETDNILHDLHVDLRRTNTRIQHLEQSDGHHIMSVNNIQAVHADLRTDLQMLDAERLRMTERMDNLDNREAQNFAGLQSFNESQVQANNDLNLQIQGFCQRLDQLNTTLEEQRKALGVETSRIRQEGIDQFAESLRRLQGHDDSFSAIRSTQEAHRYSLEEMWNTLVTSLQEQSNTLNSVQRENNDQLRECMRGLRGNNAALTGLGARQEAYNNRLDQVETSITTRIRQEQSEAWTLMAGRVEEAMGGRADTEMSRVIREMQSQIQEILDGALRPSSRFHQPGVTSDQPPATFTSPYSQGGSPMPIDWSDQPRSTPAHTDDPTTPNQRQGPATGPATPPSTPPSPQEEEVTTMITEQPPVEQCRLSPNTSPMVKVVITGSGNNVVATGGHNVHALPTRSRFPLSPQEVRYGEENRVEKSDIGNTSSGRIPKGLKRCNGQPEAGWETNQDEGLIAKSDVAVMIERLRDENQQKELSFRLQTIQLHDAERNIERLQAALESEQHHRQKLARELQSGRREAAGHDAAEKVLRERIMEIETLNGQLREKTRDLERQVAFWRGEAAKGLVSKQHEPTVELTDQTQPIHRDVEDSTTETCGNAPSHEENGLIGAPSTPASPNPTTHLPQQAGEHATSLEDANPYDDTNAANTMSDPRDSATCPHEMDIDEEAQANPQVTQSPLSDTTQTTGPPDISFGPPNEPDQTLDGIDGILKKLKLTHGCGVGQSSPSDTIQTIAHPDTSLDESNNEPDQRHDGIEGMLENLERSLREDMQRIRAINNDRVRCEEGMKEVIGDIPRLERCLETVKKEQHLRRDGSGTKALKVKKLSDRIHEVEDGLERLTVIEEVLGWNEQQALGSICRVENLQRERNDLELAVWRNRTSSVGTSESIQRTRQQLQDISKGAEGVWSTCDRIEADLHYIQTEMYPLWRLTCIQVLDMSQRIWTFCHIRERITRPPGSLIEIIDQTGLRISNKPSQMFHFDHVFGAEARNERIFGKILSPHIWSIIDHRDVCFFFNCAIRSSGAQAARSEKDRVVGQGIPTVGLILIKELLHVFNRVLNVDDPIGKLHVSVFEVDGNGVKDRLQGNRLRASLPDLHGVPISATDTASKILFEAQKKAGRTKSDTNFPKPHWGLSITLSRDKPTPAKTRLVMIDLAPAQSRTDLKTMRELSNLREMLDHINNGGSNHESPSSSKFENSTVRTYLPWAVLVHHIMPADADDGIPNKLLQFLAPTLSNTEKKVILHTIIDENAEGTLIYRALDLGQT